MNKVELDMAINWIPTMIFTSMLILSSSVADPTNADYYSWLTSAPYSTYQKKVFPKTFQNDTMFVGLKLYLITITGFDEVAGQIDMVGYLEVQWKNDLLTWTTNSMDRIMIPQANLWRPSLVLSNSVESLKELGDTSYKIRINDDGTNTWTIGVVSKTACSVDVTYYPFDKQMCNIEFNSWGYSKEQITLYSNETEIDMTHFMNSSEWFITSSSVESKVVSDSSHVSYIINMERKPGFFVVNMVVPVIILGLLNGLVFIVPVDSGERVSYAITAFLTFSVFMTMISDNLPKSSDPMSLLCYYLMLMLVLSALSTLFTIIVLRVHSQDGDSDVPVVIQRVITFIKCEKLQKKCCKQKQEVIKVENDGEVEEFEYEDDADEEVQVGDDTSVTWPVVAQTLDSFFFITFLVLTILITVLFLLPLSLAA